MSEELKLEKLIDKIRKLRNKANDAACTEAESVMFAAKVADLLAEHGLEEAQLKETERDPISDIRHDPRKWMSSPARKQMVWSVCHLFMVKPLFNTKMKRWPWSLIGRKINVDQAVEMADYLCDTVVRISNAWGRETGQSQKTVVDFRRGAFERLSERLNHLRWEREQAAQPMYNASGNPGNLPALYKSEDSLLDEFIKNSRGKIKKAVVRSIKKGWAAEHGRAAANTIGLDPQVAAGGGKRVAIGG